MSVKLKPVLSLFDAVNIALGSIIGAGIFVIIGAAAGLAGPAVFLSVLVAAAVAAMTGLTSAELSAKFPRSGGAYRFARETISDFAGFVVGWVWLFSNTVIGATVAVGFAYYLAFFLPGIPTNIAAAIAVVLATGINLLGTGESSRINNVLVALKVAILIFFIASAAFFFRPSNFEPLAPFGIGGILAGAATIFFAYSGFARVAVISDEIKDAKKNVPRATLLSILISTVLYVAVAVAAVGIAGYAALAASGSPLADAIKTEGLPLGADLIGLGALIATGTVILASVLGVSRLAFTMAENKELPAWLSATGGETPRNAILLSGAGMLLLAFFANLQSIAFISSFSLLLYYAAINLSGMKVLKTRTRYAALLGMLSCLVLMFSLPPLSWAVGLSVLALGIAYHAFLVKKH